MYEDHGTSDECEGVDSKPGGIPFRHKWPDVGELANRLDHCRHQCQQLLVQLEACPTLSCKKKVKVAEPLHLCQLQLIHEQIYDAGILIAARYLENDMALHLGTFFTLQLLQ